MNKAPVALCVPLGCGGRAHDNKSEVFPKRTGLPVLFCDLSGTAKEWPKIAN
jgi:hypothetical protein